MLIERINVINYCQNLHFDYVTKRNNIRIVALALHLKHTKQVTNRLNGNLEVYNINAGVSTSTQYCDR